MDYTKQSPAFLPTCVGMRGIERGLERAFYRLGWLPPKPVAYVEIEAFAAWNLVNQMEKGVLAPAPVWTNVKTFPWRQFRGKIDFITGGYPCQPFSLAGLQKGTEDPRHLWPHYEEGIELIRPVGCFFENVRNHLNIGYREVRSGLERLGYEVREGIYSAEEAGAPHKRDRLFILAIRRDVELADACSSAWDIPEVCQRDKAFETSLCGEAVDNANGCEQSAVTGDTGEVLGVQEAECESELSAALSGGAGEKLVHSHGFGLRAQTDACVQAESYIKTGFPMGQGVYQWDWEEPRLESRLGFTINGHNFTEDLLRMAGNGVVAQTAEIAFMDLLKQHYDTRK